MIKHLNITELALLGAGALAVALALIGWFSFTGPSENAAAAENDEAVLSAAFRISRHAGSVVAASSVINAAVAPVDRDIESLRTAVASLEGRGYDDRVARIQRLADSIITNAERAQIERPMFLGLHQEGLATYRYLNYEIGKPLDAALVTSLDNQLDRMIRGEDGAVAPSEWYENTPTARDVLLFTTCST